jgi:hypothetical protein
LQTLAAVCNLAPDRPRRTCSARLQVVQQLRLECAGLDAQGRPRPRLQVAASLQRYLLFAILACVPDRQRTLRELKLGSTLVQAQGRCGSRPALGRGRAGVRRDGSGGIGGGGLCCQLGAAHHQLQPALTAERPSTPTGGSSATAPTTTRPAGCMVGARLEPAPCTPAALAAA